MRRRILSSITWPIPQPRGDYYTDGLPRAVLRLLATRQLPAKPLFALGRAARSVLGHTGMRMLLEGQASRPTANRPAVVGSELDYRGRNRTWTDQPGPPSSSVLLGAR